LKISSQIDGEPVSPRLEPLLLAIYRELERNSVDRGALKAVLENLLLFLASPEGRTNANCWAADLFFCLREGWTVETEHVPDEFADILADMGGALHDTIHAPEIAANFYSTPEQLLERVQDIDP
jgi:hypothetical protein